MYLVIESTAEECTSGQGVHACESRKHAEELAESFVCEGGQAVVAMVVYRPVGMVSSHHANGWDAKAERVRSRLWAALLNER